jgi:hypothetical protein
MNSAYVYTLIAERRVEIIIRISTACQSDVEILPSF